MKFKIVFKFQCLLAIGLLGFSSQSIAQNAPVWGAEISEPSNAECIFPLFGEKLNGDKVSLPQPFGASVNLFYAKQTLAVENLSLGFNGGEMINVGDVVNINDYEEDMQTVNLKFDTWVLPFLNVYALGGISNIESQIDLESSLDLGMNLNTSGSFLGYGAMLASVFGPVYVSAEANAVYTFSEASSKADQVWSTSFRVGPSIGFKEHPKRNLIVWVGGLNTQLHGTSKGDYELIDLFPIGQEDINRTIGNLDVWYNGLSPSDQETYANQYETVRTGLDDVSNGIEDGKVAYAIDKKLDMPWDLLIGAQLQMNPKFLIKAEAQLLGDRTAGVLSFNYRFGN